MLFAVMDLGSNSFKLTVSHYFPHERGGKGLFRVLHKERHPVQLGASVFSKSAKISARHRALALQALARMKEQVEEYDLPLLRVVGTSALREAKNAPDFVREVERKLALKIDIISGLQEAHIIAQGLSWSYPQAERGLLIDIGGGSTEIASFGAGWKTEGFARSFRVGSVRMAALLPTSLRTPKDILKARSLIQGRLNGVEPKKFDVLVGSAGAIQSLGLILSGKKKNQVIKKSELDRWIRAHMNTPPRQLCTRYSIDPSRARVLFAGALILSEMMEWLGRETLRVTPMTLRDGLLVDFLHQLRSLHWIL